ncbi:MAG: hypothetical protein ABI569_00870 [Casimicrobiaceae bacterium]
MPAYFGFVICEALKSSEIAHAASHYQRFKECAMRAMLILLPALMSSYSMAKLPPPSDAAKALAAETAAKNAWSDKVGQYQLCAAMDRTAAAYRNSLKATGTPAPTPVETAPCVNPGPYATPVTPSASKPLEAAGAHSPPGTATSPPSTNATAAEIAGRKK